MSISRARRQRGGSTPVLVACLLAGVVCGQPVVAAATGNARPVASPAGVGQRPYEMEWAGRARDTRAPLIDFEQLRGWTVACQDSEASFARSREQQLWGHYVGKLVYRGTGNQPNVVVRPPDPVPLPASFDCVNLWVYGNNWAWAPDPSTPRVTIRVVLDSAEGETVRLDMGQVRWKEWWLMHRRLTAEQRRLLGSAPRLRAIEVANGRNTEERALFFDNLAVYQESLPPLQFSARPKRGVDLPAGQTVGTNSGDGRLPFPNRAETILPTNLTDQYRVRLQAEDNRFTFTYEGDDGQLQYTYEPRTGTLADLRVHWQGRGPRFQPLVDGGVRFFTDQERTEAPARHELIACRQQGETVVARWRCRHGERVADVTYTLRLWQKTLVIDVACPGGEIGEFRIGRATGVPSPRLVTVPYLTGAEQRPAVLVTGPVEQPLFVLPLMDHTRSNASELWFANQISDGGVVQNGGTRYLPKTDGRRNPCFERLMLTVSPRFEEVLPNVPNPKSPWMHVTGRRVWRAHGASDRQRDYALWRKVARYGMSRILITDHETGWRDGGESFTMRTRAAPGKGGDAGQRKYARQLQALGFRYGIYNNYTDFAPVNEHWDEDYVTRTPDNQWRTAWARCYNVKPARAVELEERLAPVIQEKFGLDTAYCDVHTAVRPWSYCDFDARVPGAGTFAATFYAYGEIMLHQKRTWNGPVYSEGNNHWYYCGLTDGNYGQDQLARLDEQPWLVDFDLLKLHPLCCNFGMGNPGMFYGRGRRLGNTPPERQARLDRFLAATLAFGHTGFLVMEGGFANAVQSYFAVQQIHARYASQTAASIRYADADGKLRDTSAAVAAGLHRRSQIVTRYEDGLEVWVNGHTQDTWHTPHGALPPNGWLVRDPEQEELVAYSRLVNGARVDYVDSPEYLYANARGRLTRFGKLTCDGQLIALPQPDGSCELIPVGRPLPLTQSGPSTPVIGLSLGGRMATGVALDESGKEMGVAGTRLSRGIVHVQPVPDAFSYRITPTEKPRTRLQCPRQQAIPGETLRVHGAREHAVTVPNDAPVGSLFWHQADGAWIDFQVVPLVTALLSVTDDGELELSIDPHLPSPTEATVQLGDEPRNVTLAPGRLARLTYHRPADNRERVERMALDVRAGPLSHQQTWWLKTQDAIRPLATLSPKMQTGQCLRGQAENALDARTRASVHWTDRSCGNRSRHCLFMHPPYGEAVGYSFAITEEIQLPAKPAAAFRCEVGKADGSDPGDGILFRVFVVEPNGEQTMVAEKAWIQHAWTPLEADLSAWCGKPIRLKLVADVGPDDNSAGDWACWSQLRIESRRAVPTTTVHDEPVELQREPGPWPIGTLSVQEIRSATRGVLHLQASGLQDDPPYVSQALLNGVVLGNLPAAGGDPTTNPWGEAAVPLSRKAIRQLGEWNRVELENPGRDSFKVRRFWIELEWADGRRASSQITRTVYSQPGSWLYAEGIGVPFGHRITVDVRFGQSGPASPSPGRQR